jgi:hypothetical protein
VATIGLSKGEIRRLVLRKLQVVYRDWGVEQTPFARAEGGARARREDPRAFVVALVAALLGGLSEAIERNSRALVAALAGKRRASPTATASRRARRGRATRRRSPSSRPRRSSVSR